MKKVVIIGGGVAGLSAAIYAQKNGFSTEIYEKNAMLGGECTGWNRQGYHIDNCIHYLVGCRDTDGMNEIWRDIGAIDDSVKLVREPYFYGIENNGVTLRFWSDLERTRKEFLNVAPEDSDELNKFFDSVKLSECVQIPSEKSLAEMNFIEYMKYGMKMAPMSKVMKEYGQETVSDLRNRFKNPYVKDMMTRYFNNVYRAFTLVTCIGFYTGGTAAVPAGGSVGMINRIVKRYKELGGVIHTGMSAEKVNAENGKANFVTFSDGSTAAFDALICATDFSVTFGRLLDEKYMDKNLRKMYEDKAGYRVASGFNASFGILGSEKLSAKSGSTLFPCESYTVGTQTLDFLGIRLYDNDSELYPADKSVIQCNVLQNEDDYEYWRKIYGDRERYEAEKAEIASALKSRIEARYPELSGRLVLLSTYSPVTFTKWCGAYKGAYMSFIEQKGAKSLAAKNSIKGLSNVFAASQWLMTNGGLPSAAASGKFAVDALMRKVKP